MKAISIILVTLIQLGCAVGLAEELPASFLTPEAILVGWQSTYGSLKSMEVAYSEIIVEAKPCETAPDIVETLVKWNHVDRKEDGVKFCVTYSAAEQGLLNAESAVKMTFDGEHQKMYTAGEKEGRIYAGLVKEGIGTENMLKQYLLLDYHRGSASPSGDKPWFTWLIGLGASDPNITVQVRPQMETVAGEPCHVLEVARVRGTQGKVAILWVAHEKGMLPLKYQQFDSRGSMTREISVCEIGTATINGVPSISYPKKAYRLLNLPSYLGIVKYELQVSKFVPNIKTDAKDFDMTFPEGTHVIDKVKGTDYVEGEADSR